MILSPPPPPSFLLKRRRRALGGQVVQPPAAPSDVSYLIAGEVPSFVLRRRRRRELGGHVIRPPESPSDVSYLIPGEVPFFILRRRRSPIRATVVQPVIIADGVLSAIPGTAVVVRVGIGTAKILSLTSELGLAAASLTAVVTPLGPGSGTVERKVAFDD